MPKNKPQPNLEEWLDTQTWRVDYGANVGRFEKDRLARAFAREVAKQTCDAVRVGEPIMVNENELIAGAVLTGWDNAVKAQKDKERSWMGGDEDA